MRRSWFFVTLRNQAEHHRKMTFREEVTLFLKKHGMEYEEAMLD
jgi:hypothetical protein